VTIRVSLLCKDPKAYNY